MHKNVNKILVSIFLIFLTLFGFVQNTQVQALDDDIEAYWACLVQNYYNTESNEVNLPEEDFVIDNSGSGQLDQYYKKCSAEAGQVQLGRRRDTHKCVNSLVWDDQNGVWIGSGSCNKIGMGNGGAEYAPPEELFGKELEKAKEEQEALADLEAEAKQIGLSDQVSCWMGKDDPNEGLNLVNIWNPANFLPLMHNCKTTTDEGRPVPLHPVNAFPIAVRTFGFMVSLLIWLTALMFIVYIIMWATSIAAGTVKLVKNSMLAAIFAILFVFFLYVILSVIIDMLGLEL